MKLPSNNEKYAIILYFDGVCNLCNRLVQWILLADKKERIYFAALQSATDLPKEKKPFSTVVLYHQGNYYYRSDAILKLFEILGGRWRLFTIAYIFPKFIRNWGYNFIARHRYKWFGKTDSCLLPQPKWEKRFL